MPHELQEWLPRAEILNFDEITRLVRIASDLGVTKIRITGGEPLVRQNVLQLFRQLSELTKITDIGISTNGSLLAKSLENGETVARALVKRRVRTAHISTPLSGRKRSHADARLCHWRARPGPEREAAAPARRRGIASS